MTQAKPRVAAKPAEDVAVFSSRTAGTAPDMAARMARMMAGDRYWAIVFGAILWAVYAFMPG